MHRAFAAMGGLPRRAPVPATIALLAPPAPPQTGPNQKKPASQGPAAGHKCSRCKTRPKSGSGSSLCIRCKLQREYGSPRGGFAAARKKIPPPAQTAQNAVSPQAPTTPVASSTSATSPDASAPTALQSSVPAPTSGAEAVTQYKLEENTHSVETIHLEVAGEPSLRIDRSKLRSHRILTESDWSSLKEELENEKDDFLPEDLNQTLEVELLSGQGLPVNVALPAEIMGTMDTAGTSAPQGGMSRTPPVVSLAGITPEEPAGSTTACSTPEKSLSFLDEARNSIRLYGPRMEAAFDALYASTSQTKWVTVLSVYQKKAVLAKIFERLSDLENKLLFPGERSVVSRLSRSIEQLFNSMNLLRGRMQIPTQQVSNHLNIAHNGVSPTDNTTPVGTPPPCDVSATATQMSQFSPLDQNTSHFCARPHGTTLYAYDQPSPSAKPNPEPSFQTAKSLKDEADEEIKKILAKLQSEDRNVAFSGAVLEQPSQMYTEQPRPTPPPAPSLKSMVPQQQPLNRTMFSESSSFNMQPVAVQRNFHAQSTATYNAVNGGQTSHYQVQGMNMWGTSVVPNSSLKSCTDPPLLNGTVMRSTNLVNSAMSNEAFGPPPVKRQFLNQSRQHCPPQVSSGSVVSAPQLRNLLARKVTPLPSERPTSVGLQDQNFYGGGRLNHAHSQEQLPSGFMTSLNPCNRKPTLPIDNMSSAGLAQSAPNFSAGNNYPAMYTSREQLVQQPQQYHVQAQNDGPTLSLPQNNVHVPVNSQQLTGSQNGRGPLQGLPIHPQLQQVDQVISNESFTAQWSGTNLGVFNLRG